MRHCGKCNLDKDISAFGSNSWCKACVSQWARDKRAKYSKEDLARLNQKQKAYYHSKTPEQKLKDRVKRYGITSDDFYAMLSSQDKRCKICNAEFTDDYSKITIDHDHTCCDSIRSCGKCIRGLLCHSCNRWLGVLESDFTEKAYKYLGLGETIAN